MALDAITAVAGRKRAQQNAPQFLTHGFHERRHTHEVTDALEVIRKDGESYFRGYLAKPAAKK